jgi:hypothetical protein
MPGKLYCWFASLILLGADQALATDPLDTWTVQSSDGINVLQNVVYGNDRFVAVGFAGCVMVSFDGTQWTVENSGTTNSLYTLAFGGGRFVAAGNRGTLIVSEDGFNWTGLDSATLNPLFGSTYGDGQYVVVGGSNVLVSANGYFWTNRTSPLLPRAYLNAATYGGGRFVNVGAGGYALWSTNTVDWFRSDSPVGNHFAITHANGLFVATGGGFAGFAEIGTSPDGVHWNSQTFATSASLVDVAYGNGRFVAIAMFLTFPPPAGPEFLFESRDGLTWTTRTFPTPVAINGLIYVHSRFHAVGAAGTVLRSGSYAEAFLQVAGPPGTNGLELRIGGEIGRPYRLQASSDADGTNWQDLLLFTNPIDSDTVVTDPRASRFSRRFYRVVSP